MPDYEATRAAAHVFLDVVSGSDAPGDELAAVAMETAMQRMNEVGAWTAAFDDETDVLKIDATPMMGAVIIPMRWLIRQLELATDASFDEILVKLRDYVDENMVDD